MKLTNTAVEKAALLLLKTALLIAVALPFAANAEDDAGESLDKMLQDTEVSLEIRVNNFASHLDDLLPKDFDKDGVKVKRGKLEMVQTNGGAGISFRVRPDAWWGWLWPFRKIEARLYGFTSGKSGLEIGYAIDVKGLPDWAEAWVGIVGQNWLTTPDIKELEKALGSCLDISQPIFGVDGDALLIKLPSIKLDRC